MNIKIIFSCTASTIATCSNVLYTVIKLYSKVLLPGNVQKFNIHLTKIIWHTSGKSSSFFLLNKETRTIIKLAATVELKYKRIVLPCCCTTSKHKTLFQNHKQPYHVKTCLALKIRRTTAATYYDLFSKAFLNEHSDHFNQILYKLTKPFQLTWK